MLPDRLHAWVAEAVHAETADQPAYVGHDLRNLHLRARAQRTRVTPATAGSHRHGRQAGHRRPAPLAPRPAPRSPASAAPTTSIAARLERSQATLHHIERDLRAVTDMHQTWQQWEQATRDLRDRGRLAAQELSLRGIDPADVSPPAASRRACPRCERSPTRGAVRDPIRRRGLVPRAARTSGGRRPTSPNAASPSPPPTRSPATPPAAPGSGHCSSTTYAASATATPRSTPPDSPPDHAAASSSTASATGSSSRSSTRTTGPSASSAANPPATPTPTTPNTSTHRAPRSTTSRTCCSASTAHAIEQLARRRAADHRRRPDRPTRHPTRRHQTWCRSPPAASPSPTHTSTCSPGTRLWTGSSSPSTPTQPDRQPPSRPAACSSTAASHRRRSRSSPARPALDPADLLAAQSAAALADALHDPQHRETLLDLLVDQMTRPVRHRQPAASRPADQRARRLPGRQARRRHLPQPHHRPRRGHRPHPTAHQPHHRPHRHRRRPAQPLPTRPAHHGAMISSSNCPTCASTNPSSHCTASNMRTRSRQRPITTLESPDTSARGTGRVCQDLGVTDLLGLFLLGYFRPADRRPSKVISKAFSALFQRLDQRFCPVPFGSRLMIAR